jgi:hypothetical protein
MSGKIFINYRRDDASHLAGRLYDRLAAHFPKNQIFIDVDNLDPGVDFVETIEQSVGSCDVLIAVIGRRWLISSEAEGGRRLDSPDDFVRLEIATALKRKIRVIPVLVDDASMPRVSDLPDDLKSLVRRQAIPVSHDRFSADSDRLIAALDRVFEKTATEQREREQKACLEAERHEREHVPQSQLPSPVAPSTPTAQPEADKASAETPKVVHPLPPKPSEPEPVKPPPPSSGSTGGKSPSVIAFLAIGAVLVVAGLIYVATRAFQSPPPQPAPVAAVTPSPPVIATPSAEEQAPRQGAVSPLASSTPQPTTPSPTPSAAESFALGLRYENGQGVTKDYGRAREWYQKAADAGDTRAKGSLLRVQQKSGSWVSPVGSESNSAEEQAPRQGAVSPLASSTPQPTTPSPIPSAAESFALGLRYENGQGVAKDYGKARKWYQKAADAGDTRAKGSLLEFSKKAGHG